MPKIKYKHYLLLLLTVVATFNYLDRFVLSLALESIKQEFQLSDSQLGFLTGFAFASFYAIAGVPIARWADRGNRNLIVTLTTALWSVMVAFCGLALSYVQLLLMRVGVAVGEAGCLPPANSIIADYYSRAERPKAMAIYWLCAPLAVIIGYSLGGWLIENLGWRLTFIIIGLPGILLALIVKFTLKEPRLNTPPDVVETYPPFKDVLSILWQRRTLRSIVIAFSVAYFFGLGFAQWMPAFFMRSHGMTASEIGTWFAITWGGLGFVGTYMGGVLTNRYASCQEPLQLRWVAGAFFVSGILYLMVFLSADKYHALAYMALAGVVNAMCNGPIFSAIQNLVVDRMRSATLALVFLLANFIGLGLGPLTVGAFSDLLVPLFAEDSLRYSMALFTPGLAWVGYFYWQASKTVEADIQLTEKQEGSAGQAIKVPKEEKSLIGYSAEH